MSTCAAGQTRYYSSNGVRGPHTQDILDQGSQTQEKCLYTTPMQMIRQAPLFQIHTSSALNALYTRVGYTGLHNVSGYTKTEHLPLQNNPKSTSKSPYYAQYSRFLLLHTFSKFKPIFTTYCKQV